MKNETPQTATITMTRAQAAALLSAVEIALKANGGKAPDSVTGPLLQIVERLDHAFQFGVGDQ